MKTFLGKGFTLLILATVLLLLIYTETITKFTGLTEFKKTKDHSHLAKVDPIREFDEISALITKFPNLPVKFWYTRRSANLQLNSTCAKFPDVMTFNYVHNYWQQFTTSEGTIKLFGAYLDDRLDTNVVRILGMIDRQKPAMKIFCQLWYEDSRKPSIVPVREYFLLWHEYWYLPPDGVYQPYLMSCDLPSEQSYARPVAVSLVEDQCATAGNNLKVFYSKPAVRQNFGVCIKGMNFLQDTSVRLGEWIELLLSLGVDKIFFYDIISHPNVTALLDYYERKGVIEVSPLTLSQIQLNEPILEHMYLDHETNLAPEAIPYNDCFLKHMNEFHYISVLDVDEVIMPKGHLLTWMDLIEVVRGKVIAERGIEASAYVATNCYYFDNHTLENLEHHQNYGDLEGVPEAREELEDVPQYFHMLRHVFRSKNCTPTGYYVKSIHNTRAVLAVHNHMPFGVIDERYQLYDIDLEDGYMHHYRNTCPGELAGECWKEYRKDVIYEPSALRVKKPVMENLINTLDNLGYF